MLVPITALYTVLLGVVFFVLDFRVGALRGKTGISIYDGGHRELGLEIRRQGNFTEHVPYALILIAVLELNGAPGMLLHGLGVVLLAARIAHPIGLDAEDASKPLRAVGAGGTALVSVVGIGYAAWQLVSG